MRAKEYFEGIRAEDIPVMARHADAEANPLYPVPRLMDAPELEGMFRRIMAPEAAHAESRPEPACVETLSALQTEPAKDLADAGVFERNAAPAPAIAHAGRM